MLPQLAEEISAVRAIDPLLNPLHLVPALRHPKQHHVLVLVQADVRVRPARHLHHHRPLHLVHDGVVHREHPVAERGQDRLEVRGVFVVGSRGPVQRTRQDRMDAGRGPRRENRRHGPFVVAADDGVGRV